MAGWKFTRSRTIEDWERRTKEQMETVVRIASMRLFAEFVRLSPVAQPWTWKTPDPGYVGGRFRNSWTISPTGAVRRVNRQPNAAGIEALSEADAALRTYRLGATVRIRNNLPYAIPLEYGWSPQAPDGIVRVGLRHWPTYVEQAADVVRVGR